MLKLSKDKPYLNKHGYHRTVLSSEEEFDLVEYIYIYQDNVSSFEELLKKDNSARVHQRNLKTLATEIYKIKKKFITSNYSGYISTGKENIYIKK